MESDCKAFAFSNKNDTLVTSTTMRSHTIGMMKGIKWQGIETHMKLEKK